MSRAAGALLARARDVAGAAPTAPSTRRRARASEAAREPPRPGRATHATEAEAGSEAAEAGASAEGARRDGAVAYARARRLVEAYDRAEALGEPARGAARGWRAPGGGVEFALGESCVTASSPPARSRAGTRGRAST